jgi:hypothetical protein
MDVPLIVSSIALQLIKRSEVESRCKKCQWSQSCRRCLVSSGCCRTHCNAHPLGVEAGDIPQASVRPHFRQQRPQRLSFQRNSRSPFIARFKRGVPRLHIGDGLFESARFALSDSPFDSSKHISTSSSSLNSQHLD